jgi:hypothetical protein
MTEFRAALLATHGSTIEFRGHRYKIDCHERRDWTLVCQAEDLTPTTDDERKYCIWDLWQSESDQAAEFLAVLSARAGCDPRAEAQQDPGRGQPFPRGRWT